MTQRKAGEEDTAETLRTLRRQEEEFNATTQRRKGKRENQKTGRWESGEAGKWENGRLNPYT